MRKQTGQVLTEHPQWAAAAGLAKLAEAHKLSGLAGLLGPGGRGAAAFNALRLVP